MTQRINIRDAALSNLKTISGYTFPSAGTTEGIEREKLPTILVGFAVALHFTIVQIPKLLVIRFHNFMIQ